MPFSRPDAVPPALSSAELTARMVGAGLVFAAKPSVDPDLEDTLVAASVAALDGGDLRVLAVLTTWLRVHQAHVNVDRLLRLVNAHASTRVRAYWSAVGSWLRRDRRFQRLISTYDGHRIDLLPIGTEFHVRRSGEDPRFVGAALRVPAGVLRDRSEDVLAPEVLVRRHAGYRNRVRMGPTYRADVWTVLEHEPQLSVAEVARRAGCAFATAWEVTRDFRLLRAARSPKPKPRRRR